MASETRSIYIDASHCSNNEGILTYPLPNNLEVQGQDLVAMVDDFTLAGNISSVSFHANRLYVLERTPKKPFDYVRSVQARDDPADSPVTLTISETPADRHTDLEQFTLMCDLPTTQVNPQGGKMIFYPDDTGLRLIGHIFHQTSLNMQNPPNPLPNHDDVSMRFNYTTGIGTWTSRVPLRFFTFGYSSFQNIFPSTAFQDTLRVIEVPQGDYSAATFRPLLERLLNEQPFRGSDPEGSGSRYVVEGSGDDVRVRLAVAPRVATDRFRIVSDDFLRSSLDFPGQYDCLLYTSDAADEP